MDPALHDKDCMVPSTEMQYRQPKPGTLGNGGGVSIFEIKEFELRTIRCHTSNCNNSKSWILHYMTKIVWFLVQLLVRE